MRRRTCDKVNARRFDARMAQNIRELDDVLVRAVSGCRNTPLPAPFTYRETAAPAFLYRHAPFLLLGFMFQLIARHLLHTLNIIVVESFTTPHHYCPMSVQPLLAFTVT